ncbi:MAG: lipopolysaccharide assembly protein LapA domain-containing protein [Akkermansiaceae bacterium]
MTLAKKIKLILVITIISLVAIVIFQNTEAVTANLLFKEVSMSLSLMLLLTFLLGIITGFVSMLFLSKKKVKKVEAKL